jgi:hypothetical protein
MSQRVNSGSTGDEVVYAFTLGAQKGNEANYVYAVRTSLRTRPLCQPLANSE